MTAANKRFYSYAFFIPAGAVFAAFFLLPTLMSFFFAFTRWTLEDWTLIGFDNFLTFFSESSLNIGFRNTLIYSAATCAMKVALGFLFGSFLCTDLKTKGFLRSMIYFPTILGTIAVGITFTSLMKPNVGLIAAVLSLAGLPSPDWLGDPRIALYSVALVDVWKGVGIATVIYIAGIQAIPKQYFEALMIDGGNLFHRLRYITLPLCRPAMNSVIILAFIGGLRSFDLIWTMTKGGPGFTTDLIASIIYKQYQGGFYGLATAGNVCLFLVIAALVVPLNRFLTSREVDL